MQRSRLVTKWTEEYQDKRKEELSKKIKSSLVNLFNSLPFECREIFLDFLMSLNDRKRFSKYEYICPLIFFTSGNSCDESNYKTINTFIQIEHEDNKVVNTILSLYSFLFCILAGMTLEDSVIQVKKHIEISGYKELDELIFKILDDSIKIKSKEDFIEYIETSNNNTVKSILSFIYGIEYNLYISAEQNSDELNFAIDVFQKFCFNKIGLIYDGRVLNSNRMDS